MSRLAWIALFAASLALGEASAGTHLAPRSFAFDFSKARLDGDRIALDTPEPWLVGIERVSGFLEGRPQAWVADNRLPYGQGRMNIRLNRSALPADLALTLVYEDSPNADIVVQLADDEDRILVLDAFSNIITAGRKAKTDTFILAMAHRPSATQIVLRRLQGDVRVYGFVLTPVVCGAPPASCDDEDMTASLIRDMDGAGPLAAAAEAVAPGRPIEWDQREARKDVPVTETNAFARTSLTDAAYPEFRPSPTPVAGNITFATSASAILFIHECTRALLLYHPGARVDAPSALTSRDARDIFMEGGASAFIMSEPISSAEREQYHRRTGGTLLELPVAIDAIQVVVHDSNPIRELTLAQLDAIYGTELRAGASAPARVWGDVGAKGEWAGVPTVIWGGSKESSTTRVFQKLVLQGGPFRDDLINDPIRYYISVLDNVSNDPRAIGYSNLQHTAPRARQLALAVTRGEPAYPPSPEAIYSGRYPLTRFLYLYLDARTPPTMDPVLREFLSLLMSREGQSIVARRNQIPLGAEQVRRNREALGLP